MIPKFAPECAASLCELRNRDTSAGQRQERRAKKTKATGISCRAALGIELPDFRFRSSLGASTREGELGSDEAAERGAVLHALVDFIVDFIRGVAPGAVRQLDMIAAQGALPLLLCDRATSGCACLVLESVSELIKLDVGEPQRAALISPLRHCSFDLAENVFRLGRRDPEVGRDGHEGIDRRFWSRLF